MNYELKLEHFEGPLSKLLELIEEKKLDIALISLAQVTADFLAYVGKLKAETITNPQLVADFLSVASKLILIKSKILIPFLELEKEEESDIQNLEIQLKLYKEFKTAGGFVKDLWREMPQMGSREFLATLPQSGMFYPPRGIHAEELHRAFLMFLGEFERVFKPVEVIKQEMVSLKDKLEDVLRRIREGATNFHTLHKGSRKEVVVLFLAILQLIKDQLITVEQQSHFSDMRIIKN